jgi:hypothetical protein
MERGAKERNHQLYKPYTNGKLRSFVYRSPEVTPSMPLFVDS